MDLNYETSEDREIYIEDKINICDKKIEIRSTTVSGSIVKENEDSFAVRIDGSCLWIAVFDGTTSLKEIPNIKGAGARFASHYLKDNFYNIKLKTPTKTLVELNERLLEKSTNLGGDLSDTHSLPAAMGTIIKIDFQENILYLAHVGDTYAITFNNDGSSKIITDDRNKKFDDEMFSLMKEIAKEQNISNKQVRQDERVNKALIEMFIKRNNNPNGDGSGIINGDPNMEKYIYERSIDITDTKSVLVASDGFEIQSLSLEDSKNRTLVSDIIEQGGMRMLIKRKKESEDDDPEWNNIRYKHSDDATGVYLTLPKKN